MGRRLSKRFRGVYVSELKNGDKSYTITYKDEHGKKVWESIGLESNDINEQYANRQRIDRINKINQGEPVDVVNLKRKRKDIITLNQLFDHYIKHKEMKDRTKRGYVGRWDKHIRKSLGSKNAKVLSASTIIDARSKWDLSEKSKEMMIGLIGAAYRFSVVHNSEYKGISSPMEELKALDKLNLSKEIRKKRRNTRDRYLSKDEIIELREAIKDNPLLSLAVEIMLSTGVRITGALTIRKRHIDMNAKQISLIDHKNGGETYPGYMTEELYSKLQMILPSLRANDFVLNNEGKEIPYRTIARHLQTILNDLFNEGIDPKNTKERIVIHSLRHTFASHLALGGTPIYVIRKLMNHADIEMTMRYAKLSPDSGTENVQSLYQ